VFLEGARPGASDKLGLGYEQIQKVNPSIVYCSLTGFGQDGPFAQMGTHGGAYDAVTGTAVPYQLKDGSYIQYRPYPHIGTTSGPWLAATAILGGVIQAKESGKGCYLDISCADASVMALDRELEPVLNRGEKGWPEPEEHLSVKYCYYKTKDNEFMLL